MTTTELYELKQTFLQEWPLSRIKIMTLDEYTNLDKTSFCYWLEAKTANLGSIWGGSAYKFGIYKRKDISTTIIVDNRISDGEYAWFSKYGQTKNEAFEKVRSLLVEIINNAQNNTIESIDAIDLGNAYKWKIVFLYNDFNVGNIFKQESLLEAAQSLGYKAKDKAYSTLNRYIIARKESSEDYFDYTFKLWEATSLNSSIKYWLYAPGENADRWEEFYAAGIMALGWDELGNLNNYDSKKDIKKRLQEIANVTTTKQNDTAANFEFYQEIKAGDIVIVKKGRTELLGYGEVLSDYYYDQERNSFKSCRLVDWKLKGNWKVDFSLVLKTLTDITKYKVDGDDNEKYYEKLLRIMGNSTKSKINYKGAFSDWLTIKTTKKSGAKSSYLRAIEILSETIGYLIFEENNYKKMDLLYEDLKTEQGIEGGKYWNQKSTSYGKEGFYSAAINKYSEFLKQYLLQNPIMKTNSFSTPLNQILYGPPGTGKTYNTVLEAAKIVTGNASMSYGEALDEFNKKLGNQIEFITFHQNYSYEDFIQGIRPDTENGKELSFEKKDGVFKRIADRALKNTTDSEKPESAKKEFDIVFQELIKPLNDLDVVELEIKMKKSSFYLTEIGEKSIEFRKNIGESQHTLSINTLRKMYEKGVNDIILGGLQPYYNPILALLLEKGKSQLAAVERKNYVIIIDEINRANISRVFGELITLIEEDKRSDGKIPLRVTLPSGDSFIVPSNLYIIGTMNTADKSIALLDIALRRRFDFIPMYPLYNGLEENIYDTNKLQIINEAILIRKSHDFTIGHAYFMGDGYTLENTINKKVIPLLLEYFMNDEKEVTAILQAAAIKIGGWPLKMLS
jgi:5-methylcytosine-specific restriction endonuclease McrBC GTP-binding regulatory subunit McrB